MATHEEPWGENVLVEFEDGIAWVSMNRPAKKNAINVELAREMSAVVDALEVDDRCKVLVLTGSGDSFSAGMDLKDYFRATDNAPDIDSGFTNVTTYGTQAMTARVINVRWSHITSDVTARLAMKSSSMSTRSSTMLAVAPRLTTTSFIDRPSKIFSPSRQTPPSSMARCSSS